VTIESTSGFPSGSLAASSPPTAFVLSQKIIALVSSFAPEISDCRLS
jgi:hypothetical protein